MKWVKEMFQVYIKVLLWVDGIGYWSLGIWVWMFKMLFTVLFEIVSESGCFKTAYLLKY